eukprot:TRINITY_DN830_c0_g1_i1.p1 TRINITY_DN830_c0_g1~~TRINITY_DN830_c0_g1_i1.p1  ORF type:complete len:293 (-),score=115.84 TRINITY_DN830_c0_g1_i1:240-1118(-)
MCIRDRYMGIIYLSESHCIFKKPRQMKAYLPSFLLILLLGLASMTASQYYIYEGYEEEPDDEDDVYDPSTDDGSGQDEPDYYFHNDEYEEGEEGSEEGEYEEGEYEEGEYEEGEYEEGEYEEGEYEEGEYEEGEYEEGEYEEGEDDGEEGDNEEYSLEELIENISEQYPDLRENYGLENADLDEYANSYWQLDLNNDGFLQLDEILNIEEWEESQDQIEEWFNEADEDEDGELYFTEFVDLLFIREDAIFQKEDLQRCVNERICFKQHIHSLLSSFYITSRAKMYWKKQERL